MKHATDRGLDKVEELLVRVRQISGLSEKKRGVFYRKSRAFLHFHEEGDDVYLDARLGGPDFDRFCVSGRADRAKALAAIRAFLTEAARSDR